MTLSVTATEIEKGIINNPSAVGTTMSFYRVLQDIESGLNDAAVSRFVDVNVTEGTTVINKSHQQSITKFILDPVKALLPTNDCRELCAQWKPGGIPSDVSKQTEVRFPSIVQSCTLCVFEFIYNFHTVGRRTKNIWVNLHLSCQTC